MRPIRTALFAPGINERVMTKAFESGADAVIFDLEDSVPVAAKTEARELVVKAIDRAHAAGAGPLVTVRVNASASGLLKDDLLAVVRPGLSAIFLSKAESREDVSRAAAMLEWLEPTHQMKPGAVEIILMVESALGVYGCFDMLKASPRVTTACIGSAQDGDLQSDLGCAWSSDGPELMYAKSKVLLDTRAAGRRYPLDGVYSDLKDEEGLVRDSQISARLGYVGRTVIHPKQIEPVRRAYAVPAEQVAYYTRVVNEFEAAEKAGTAAITVDGKLVDYAMYSRAKKASSSSPRWIAEVDFAFTPEQESLRDHARELLDEVCPPQYAERCDNEGRPPREAYEALAQHGWLGIIVPPDYGGTGGSTIDLAIFLEEVGRHFEELGMWVFRTLTYGGYAVAVHGTSEQKQTLLPRVARGELSFCFGLTEPQAGSDAASIITRAVRSGDEFIINGQKVFTSGMDISDYCLLVTRTSTQEKKQQGITAFLVDTRLPGIDVRKIETLGQRAIKTTQVFYSDVKVPASMVLGEVDRGWQAVDAYLWYERLCLAAARTGAAMAAFDYALEYAKTRQQFGRPIGKFQAISHKLADMKVMLDVSRMLVYRFAWLMQEGQATRHDAAVLKLYTGEAYKNVSDMGLQILGGYGYCMEYPMQRFFRDSRLAVIGAGTSEIQRNIIARGLGL